MVDTTSSSKYLIKANSGVQESGQETKMAAANETAEPSFGDRALSIGKGIVNRLKARLNLEEAAESIKEKKEKLVGNKEGEEKGG